MGQVITRGGCIRFDEGGPVFHINSMHKTCGIDLDSLTIDTNGHLNFTLIESMPVVAAIAVPDESLVGRGISAGISGGVGLCIVRFHEEGTAGTINLKTSAGYAKLAGPTCNIWVAIHSYQA